MEFISSGKRRSYDEFIKNAAQNSRDICNQLRDYCFSLGKNVVEDVRMHRVVFCKSMTFRWFADVEPTQDGVTIKIHKNRKEKPTTYELKSANEIGGIKDEIKNAYTNI